MSRFPIPITLPGLHEGRAPSITRPSTRMVILSGCLALVGLLGGLALALQWQARTLPGQNPLARQGGDKVAMGQTIARLETEQTDLKRQVADLRARLSSLQNDIASRKANLDGISKALNHEQVAAGLVALAGQGLIATYNDSTSPVLNPHDDPANYILHDYDLRDVLNALWAAGAEGISVNGERIMANTSLYCVGTTIICNATRLSPPYVINAIGNPNDLEAALRASSQTAPLNQRALIYDLGIEIHKETKVRVPAYSGSYGYKYAAPADAGP